MPDKKPAIIPFQKVIHDLLKWLRGSPFVIIGGVAASLLGRPRFTEDIDALVLLENEKWNDLVNSSKKFGFAPRINGALKFAEKNRVLLMKHSSTGVEIDISFGALPFEKECIARARNVRFTNFKIPIPTPEDLIIMKAVSHRGKDLIDIESIVEANPKLDVKRIKHWVTEFAKVLEMPEIWDDVRKIIGKRK